MRDGDTRVTRTPDSFRGERVKSRKEIPDARSCRDWLGGFPRMDVCFLLGTVVLGLPALSECGSPSISAVLDLL